MPFSSSSLTSVASLNRGGGCVNFCSGRISWSVNRSPRCIAGRTPDTASTSLFTSAAGPAVSPALSSLKPCAAIHPLNFSTEPLTRNVYAPAATSTVVSSKRAGGICDATNRFQIRR